MSTKRDIEAIATHFEDFDYVLTKDGQTLCGCGCQAEVRKGRQFLQGHDRRFIGDMVNATMANAEVRQMDGGMLITTDAKNFASGLLSERGMERFNEYLSRAETPAKRPSRARTAKAEAPAEPEHDLTPFQAKVGRWEREVHPVAWGEDGEVTEVRFETAKGDQFATKFTRI